MQNAITQIGSFSFYSNKPVGQGATGLVYFGNKIFLRKDSAIPTSNQ